MGQERRTNLVLLNIESKAFMEMDFDNVNKKFSLCKAQKNLI